jgi:hypothetical protein
MQHNNSHSKGWKGVIDWKKERKKERKKHNNTITVIRKDGKMERGHRWTQEWSGGGGGGLEDGIK